VLDGFLLLMTSSMNPLPSLLPFFGLGVTKDAAKPNCFLPIGDNGSSNGLCSSGKLIVQINEAQLRLKLQSCQNSKTDNHTLISYGQFLRKILLGLQANRGFAKLAAVGSMVLRQYS
jgi:hypothetical protein